MPYPYRYEREILADAHHKGRKYKGRVCVQADDHDSVVVVARSEQGYAPGARGFSHGGVAALSAAEARELAAALLAAADAAEAA